MCMNLTYFGGKTFSNSDIDPNSCGITIPGIDNKLYQVTKLAKNGSIYSESISDILARGDRIYNGRNAEESHFLPWQVQIMYGFEGKFCGGTLIKMNIVFTARVVQNK